MKAQFTAIFLALAAPCHSQIFADVETTLGNFTIQLNHQAAPRTVANFMTLAEGTRAWVNPATGAVHTNEPFYNGVEFTRVIANFMSQTGSRLGDLTDGPGYTFRDEANNGLLHSGPHIVSMAHSGPNTNGAQFFITDVATPHLDGLYTVFGFISSGTAVVDAINNVPTDANDRPLSPVAIQSITIRKVGAAANAFDPFAQGLGVVMPLTGTLQKSPTAFTLQPASLPTGPFMVTAYGSQTLQSWSPLLESYHGTDNPLTGALTLGSTTLLRSFYHLALVHEPDAYGPGSMKNRIMTVQVPSLSATLTITFNSTGMGGTVHFSGDNSSGASTGAIIGIDQDLQPHFATLIIESTTLIPLQFRFGYDSRNATHILGRNNLKAWSYSTFSWQDFGQGPFTLTR